MIISLRKKMAKNIKIVYNKLKFYLQVNWIKTLYFNFKKFPFNVAKYLPVFFYGKVKFADISGIVEITAPIKKGMIGFGQPYEMNTLHKGVAEINISGNLVFRGHMQFGKDYFIFIGKDANCEFGHMSSLGTNAKIIAVESVILGNFARFGSECQIMDTNFHRMIDTITKEPYKLTKPVMIGNFNYIGTRVLIMPGTQTPNYCTITSNSMCNKNLSKLEENIMLAGIPAKLVKNNISRDWEKERDTLENYLRI